MIEGLPPRLAALPRDARGYAVPWFVWRDASGKPDFRIIDTAKFVRAIKLHLCWICGGPLGRHLSFVVGPMCTVNRISSEPPSHLGCAHYAVRNCPFLTHPLARRNERTPKPEHTPGPGMMLEHNPGAAAIWTTRSFDMVSAGVGNPGKLFSMGEPTSVEWFTQGRPASRAEVDAAIERGLPALYDLNDKDQDPAAGLKMIGERLAALQAYLPGA